MRAVPHLPSLNVVLLLGRASVPAVLRAVPNHSHVLCVCRLLSAPQCQHVFLLFHPPDPRPVGPAWLDLLLAGSGKLALLHRMLQVGWEPCRLQAGSLCASLLLRCNSFVSCRHACGP